MKQRIIIGFTGYPSCGKGEAASYLRSKGFVYLSLSDILREEAIAAGIGLARHQISLFANNMRKVHGPGVLAKKTIARINEMPKETNLIIDSIRNPGEIELLKQLEGFSLVVIDAPASLRFEWMKKRARPGDPATLEEFEKIDEDMKEAHGLRIGDCMKLADHTIVNDSTLENLHEKINQLLEELGVLF